MSVYPEATGGRRYDPYHVKCLRTASERLLAALVREHGDIICALTKRS